MNLSASAFALDNESYFWKQGIENDVDDGKKEDGGGERPQGSIAEGIIVDGQSGRR